MTSACRITPLQPYAVLGERAVDAGLPRSMHQVSDTSRFEVKARGGDNSDCGVPSDSAVSAAKNDHAFIIKAFESKPAGRWIVHSQ
jgi:hypothetical protein